MRRSCPSHVPALTPGPSPAAAGEGRPGFGLRTLAAAGTALVLLVLGAAVVGCGDDAGAETVDSATITIRHSTFDVEEVTVRAGQPVTITLVNGDPIGHEWMVGDAAMHDRHRTGTEPHHDSIPTEVSLAPYETKVTTVTFEKPGKYRYICHLPGHEDYGMVGVLRVI